MGKLLGRPQMCFKEGREITTQFWAGVRLPAVAQGSLWLVPQPPAPRCCSLLLYVLGSLELPFFFFLFFSPWWVELVVTCWWNHERNITSLSKGAEGEGSAKPTTFSLALFGSFSLVLAEKHTSNSRQHLWVPALSQCQELASCALLASQHPSQFVPVLPASPECWHYPSEGPKGQSLVFIYFQKQIDTRYLTAFIIFKYSLYVSLPVQRQQCQLSSKWKLSGHYYL